MASPKRGEVWLVALDPTIGSEQRKTRPCVIVQRDSANASSPTTIVCPCSDAQGRSATILSPLLNVSEGGLQKVSRVLCNQVRAIDKARLVGDPLGVLSADSMRAIEHGLRAILDLSLSDQ
ncbi:MAG TPA: type II toxin-antitoxin system PemK/MazF family toxin [Candidatus Baltobacteraceae bacterium]|jgi:mRNA interferase MazF|nr:type II toxin-antitoxin system PemK/MazF family toxin [Candidatus Baltobacteraceae bacterium]